MKDVVVLTLAAIAGLLGVAKAVYDYRQTRVRPITKETTRDLRLLTLQTEREKYMTPKKWRQWKGALWLNVIFGSAAILWSYFAFIYALSGRSVFGLSNESLAFWIALGVVLTYGVFVLTFSIVFVNLARGKATTEPLHSVSASLIVKGSPPSIIAQCQDALASMNAVRGSGTQIVAHSSKYARLEAGTGPWPKKSAHGQKITINIRRCHQEVYSIKITSACYFPSLFVKKKNSANVARILQQFL